ncbi:MAG: pyridoxamine 5'-phosphate oxidase family protein [Clostridia bacterium]|nr:pyridoxamine 5'-phosphate oxidase family protein [Clostridia bacterium]
MFREVVRFKQALSPEASAEVLKAQVRGVLSVQGDDGYPYALPIDYYYNPQDGHLYFHSGKTGHKMDAIEKDDKVSFCVIDEGFRRPGEWALNFQSVIVFGRIRKVEDPEKANEMIRKLCYRFTDDLLYIEQEFRRSGANTVCLELIPEHITGKRVNES